MFPPKLDPYTHFICWQPQDCQLIHDPVKIRIFCPKKSKFGPKMAFLFILGQALPAHLVGGCGARAVSRKTPITLCTSHPLELYEITVSKVWPGFSFSKDYFSKLLLLVSFWWCNDPHNIIFICCSPHSLSGKLLFWENSRWEKTVGDNYTTQQRKGTRIDTWGFHQHWQLT